MDRGGGVLGSGSTMKLEVPERGHATEAGCDALVQRRRARQDLSMPLQDPGQGASWGHG